MHIRSNSNRPRAVAVTVVAGILLTLAIAGWWQVRRAGYYDQRVLQDLKEQFSTAHIVLERHLDEHLQNLEALEDLLQVIEGRSSGNPGSASVAVLLETVDPVSSKLADGPPHKQPVAIDRLADSALRAKLSAWASAIAEVHDDQEIATKMVDEVYLPYFRSKNVLVAGEPSDSDDSGGTPDTSLSGDPDTIGQVLEDPKFHVLVAGRLGFQNHLITELENAITAAENVVAELEKSID